MKMIRQASILILTSLLTVPSYTLADTYIKDNGIIKIKINEPHPNGVRYPLISSVYITNQRVMPPDNAGADFQITTRSSKGNLWNPTLGGDCRQNPSKLTSVVPNWVGAGLPDIPSSNGILIGVKPRLYNEPGLSGCLGDGDFVPVRFNFGVTLGDGPGLPKQGMIIDMSVKRDVGAEVLRKHASEFPVAFPYANLMRYAYYSVDGKNFLPFEVDYSNDTNVWPVGVNYKKEGRAIALCQTKRSQLDGTVCMAFYSHTSTTMTLSLRDSGSKQLNLMTLLAASEKNALQQSDRISDYQWHTKRALMAVGRIGTIKAVISIAESKIDDWGRF
jgi:hypothetical protein